MEKLTKEQVRKALNENKVDVPLTAIEKSEVIGRLTRAGIIAQQLYMIRVPDKKEGFYLYWGDEGWTITERKALLLTEDGIDEHSILSKLKEFMVEANNG